MRRFLLALFLFVVSTPVLAQPVEVEILSTKNDSFQHQITGRFTLREPVTDRVLGVYNFVSGGCGRGPAPFGTYHIGRFRDVNDDPKHIGPRWMLRQKDRDEGEAWDPELDDMRTSLELHSLHVGHVKCTFGCIGIETEQWDDFRSKIEYLISWYGEDNLTFEFRKIQDERFVLYLNRA